MAPRKGADAPRVPEIRVDDLDLADLEEIGGEPVVLPEPSGAVAPQMPAIELPAPRANPPALTVEEEATPALPAPLPADPELVALHDRVIASREEIQTYVSRQLAMLESQFAATNEGFARRLADAAEKERQFATERSRLERELMAKKSEVDDLRQEILNYRRRLAALNDLKKRLDEVIG